MLTVIPDVVRNQTIQSLLPSCTVHDAARRMLEHDISAIVVLDDQSRLLGIVTERDITRRVAAENLESREVTLDRVMTTDISTLSPGDSALEALERMRKLRVRHLPIVDGAAVVGIVSIRDLRHTVAERSISTAERALARGLHRLARCFE